MKITHIDELENIQEFYDEVKDETIVAPIYIGNNRYIIKDILSNSGGFGIIYIALDTRLQNREVLVKANKYSSMTIKKSETDLTGLLEDIIDMRKSIEWEKRTLVSLKRGKEARMPSVIEFIKDYSPQLKKLNISEHIYNNEPYIIMQKIEGNTLSSYRENKETIHILEERGYEDIAEWELDVLSYAYQICTILEGFHKREIVNSRDSYYVYQDLKPENIILSYDKLITLLDFGGMTRVFESTLNEELITQTDNKWGSPGLGSAGYIAPESEALSNKIDERVDVFTLGATMFNLLTGIKPNEVRQKSHNRLPINEILEEGYSEVTYKIIEKCTQIDRNDRYANIGEVKSEIGRAFSFVKKKAKVHL